MVAGLVAVPAPTMATEAVARIGLSVDIETLDWHRTRFRDENRVAADLCMGLLTTDAELRPVPGAAQSWTVSPDGRTYTFRLRAEGRWSDGSPVTAPDFVAAWRRLVAPATASTATEALAGVGGAADIVAGVLPVTALGVEAPDNLTFTVHLDRPRSEFLEAVSVNPALCPLHPAAAAAGVVETAPGRLIGNGPFVLMDRRPQEGVVLARNPQFWDAAAVKLDRIEYKVVPDSQGQLARFRTGQLDVADAVPRPELDWIRANLPESLRAAPGSTTLYLAVAPRTWRADARGRRALGLAIDRKRLAGAVLRGADEPAHGLVPPGASGFTGQAFAGADWPEDRRADTARRLLAEVADGRQRPAPIELLHAATPASKQIAIAVAAMWGDVLGLQVQLLAVDGPTLLRRLRQGEYDIALAGYAAPRASAWMALLKQTGLRTDVGLRYDNAAFEALVERAAATQDDGEASRLLAEAEQLILADMAVIPLVHPKALVLVAPSLSGVILTPRGLNAPRHWARVSR